MRDLLTFFHLAAAIVWMGGMAFMLLALRPAALAALEPAVRARLMDAVLRRFFPLVLLCIAVLLATAGPLYSAGFRATRAATGTGGVPLGWNLMLLIGLAMVLIFGHIYLVGFRRFKRAVASSEWPVAAQAAAQIHALVVTNFVLGWLAIAAVRLLRL